MITPGDLIDGRYIIGDLLGRGGMAEVHRATDIADGRAYAVKVVRGTEPGLDDRFRREAEALARVDHPGLIRLHRSGTHEGAHYLVLDLAEGPPLSQALAGGPAGVERTVSVGRQVAAALAHVHRAGLVHRDVKPSNILLHHDRVLLADFGIARLPGAPSLTLTGQVIGSAPYLAPEQVEGAPAGPPADVYALGLVLIECLTGRRCFPGTYAESAIARLHRAPEIPAVPAWLRDVLVAMTMREPSRRPPAGAVAASLARRDAGPVVGATAPLALAVDGPHAPGGGGHGARVTAVRPVRRRHAGARALAAAAAVLVTLGWTVLGGDPPSQPAATQPTAPPTTAPALVAHPAAPAGAADGSAAAARGGRPDRAAAPAPGPAAAPVEAASTGPANAAAAAVRPAALDTGPPPAADVDVTPTTAPPTTTVTTAPPPGNGSGNGSGNGNGNGSGNGTGTGGDGTEDGDTVTTDPDPASGTG